MALELKLTDQKCWQISPYLAEYLAVEEGTTVCLQIGKARGEVVVKCHGNYTSMNLNTDWAADLKLTPGKWKVRPVKDGIRIGPIIGIVCKELPSRPPVESSWTRYLTAIEGGKGILLTQEGFDPGRQCVYGFTLSEDKLHWVKGEMPWPDALFVRTYPINSSFQIFLQREFPDRHFNTKTLFNKWLIFQILFERKNIKPYLPDTAILESEPAFLKSWVARYSAVYAKPVLGHKGFGVMKISPDHGTYLIKYRQGQQDIEVTVPISVPIRQELIDVMGESQYIIQQALFLPELDNRTSDLRVLMQKKDDGLWHITGLWGRRGAEGSIVNNLAGGGELIPPVRILENGTIPKIRRIKEIHQLCLQVALTLDSYFGQLGEIGLDLCIDCQEHLWILEVNGMPGKNFFTEFCSPNVAKSVYTAPMLYAAYLSGFSDVIYPLAK
ncbi:MAG: YheC/YheD family endospore coat-associated protein [Desulfitobacteriaceae bacterium]